MSTPTATRGPVVADTNVLGLALADRRAPLAERYEPLLVGRPVHASFMTEAELLTAPSMTVGASVGSCLEALLTGANIVWPTRELTKIYAELRSGCRRAGHPLGSDSDHESDRWIAATALWLDVPLLSADKIFLDVRGLDVI